MRPVLSDLFRDSARVLGESHIPRAFRPVFQEKVAISEHRAAFPHCNSEMLKLIAANVDESLDDFVEGR